MQTSIPGSIMEGVREEDVMKIKEIMNKPVKSISSNKSLREAGRLMAENDCGVLPVVDEIENVVGVLTDRDVCLALAREDRRPSEVLTKEVMSPNVFFCRPDDDLPTALSTMQSRLVRRLPVIDEDGKLEGIVSIDDIVIHASPVTAAKAAEVTYGEAFSTLKAICGMRVARRPAAGFH
jgi:FOG: CBS domain